MKHINKQLIKKYPSIEFIELEKFKLEYQKRYFKYVDFKKEKSKRTLGRNGILFLSKSLGRSRSLFDGFIDCINTTNAIVGFLIVRAHFESTASISYLLNSLYKFYDNEIEYDKINSILSRLSIGGKNYTESRKLNTPQAINILTQIETADKLFSELLNDKEIFKDSYDLYRNNRKRNCEI